MRQIFKDDNKSRCSRAFDSDKKGFISKPELIKIVEHLFHLVPQCEKEQLTTPEKFADELITEMDIDQVGTEGHDNPILPVLKDGVITECELVTAVLRADHLTTFLVNRIIIRFYCAEHKIRRK